MTVKSVLPSLSQCRSFAILGSPDLQCTHTTSGSATLYAVLSVCPGTSQYEGCDWTCVSEADGFRPGIDASSATDALRPVIRLSKQLRFLNRSRAGRMKGFHCSAVAPTNRGYYAESSQARALTIGDVEHPLHIIYFILRGGLQVAMAEQHLDGAQVSASLQQVSCLAQL